MPFLIKGKTNWKYILIVVVLAVIVGGGILGYSRYFKRKIISLTKFPEIKKPEKVEEETANWKTYRNEEYGFEIKYPEDWIIDYGGNYLSLTSSGNKRKCEETISLYPDSREENQWCIPDIKIDWYENINEEPENKINQLGATTLEELITRNKNISSPTKTTFAGEEAYEVIWAGADIAFKAILIEKNKHLYVIYTDYIKGDYHPLSETGRKILSTFRFLE